MRNFLIGLAAVAALTAPTQAFAQEAEDDVIVDPAWVELPSPEILGLMYPSFAGAMGMSGSAELKCRVTMEGRLALCEVVKALPADLGFGRAALESTPLFRLSPRTVNGDVRKSYVQFTVRFAMPSRDIEPWSGKEPPPAQVAALRKAFDQLVDETGPPPGIDLDKLGVDDARRDEVVAMIQSVESDLLDQRLDAMALALARAASAEQITAMINGLPPPGPMPEGLEQAGPELAEVQRLSGQRIRDLYCARYRCLPEGAAMIGAEPMNAVQEAARARAEGAVSADR